jgi:hypothetical protein
MNSADYAEVQLGEDTYKLAEKCAKKLGMTVDEFVSKAIDEKHENLKCAHNNTRACFKAFCCENTFS